MVFTSVLRSGTLVKRYKRFLADILFEDGALETVYCPNTGSMRSCSAPGSEVMVSRAENIKRKYPWTLEMVKVGEGWVGINTSRTNRLVEEALRKKQITGLEQIDSLTAEVTVKKGTRLDFMARQKGQDIYIEVKNCTLVEDGVAMFPDAITARGTRHLYELADCVSRGDRGVIFYLVQRCDCDSFSPAAHIDTIYADALRYAVSAGVEIMAYQARVTPEAIEVVRELSCRL